MNIMNILSTIPNIPRRYRTLTSATLLAIVFSLAFSACGNKDTDNLIGGSRLISTKDSADGITAKDMYNIAQEYFRRNNITDAIKVLQQLETYFPYSIYARQAQLSLASALLSHRKI